MTNQRTVKITELPASTQDFNDTDRLVAVQPFGSSLLTVQLPGSAVLNAARAAGATAAGTAGLHFTNVADAQTSDVTASRLVGATLTTAGYAEAGDWGGATYQKVAIEPAHDGKFQDIRGGWWELFADVYRPEMFGGWSGGVTGSDTAAILAAMTAAVIAGKPKVVAFASGRRYRCGALLIPNIPSSSGEYLSLLSDGWTFIEAIDEGDTDHLWAPYNWVYGGTAGNRRTVIRGFYFDAKSLKDYALVVRGNSWEVSTCYFTGALEKGWFHTNNNRDNNAEGGSVNCFFFHCESRQNPGDGWEFDEYSVDYQVSHCYATGNVRWGAKFMGGSGCQIDAINVYGNNSGGEGGCAYFDQWGWATVCANSLFDGTSRGDVVVRSNNPTYAATWGPRNNVKNGNLVCEVLNPKLVLLNIEMQGSAARIVHNNGSSESRQLHIMGGKSSAVPFILFTDANDSLLGTTIASMHYNQGTDAWYDGRILTYPARVTDGHAPSLLMPARIILNSSTTTTITIPLTVEPEGLAGSWLDIDLKASVLSGSPGDTVSIARATVWAFCSRQYERPTRAFDARVINQESEAPGAITFAASMTMPGDSDTMTATIEIVVTHPLPNSEQNGVLYVDVRGLHRSVTSMLLTVS